jgi:hypothetical protein
VDHTKVIRQNYIYLIENLDAINLGLVDQLFADKIIDQTDKEDLESRAISTRRIEKLLSIVSRKSAERFEQFLGALDKTGQQHISAQLRSCQTDGIKDAVENE